MNDQLVAAKQAIAAGQKGRAVQILRELANNEPDNVRAWLYLAGLAPHAKGREACLRRAEQIDPNHPLVLKARQWAAGDTGRTETPAPTPSPEPEPIPARIPEPELPLAAAPAPISFEPEPEISPVGEIAAPEAVALRRPLGRMVWMTAAVVLVCLLLAGGSLAYLTGWPFDPIAVEPAAVDNELAIAATAEPAQAESLAEATLPPATLDQFNNDGRRLSEPGEAEADGDLPGKSIVADSGERQAWTATPSPTHTPTPTPTFTPTPTIPPTFVSQAANVDAPAFLGLNERWIDVNLSTQTLNAFEGNKLVFSTLISSGLPAYPTVTGQFRIYLEYQIQTMDGRTLGYDYVVEDVPWVMYFFEDYAIHGAYWHNNFGYPMSHGCVNMSVAEAKWIYDWASIGTLVNVHY